MVGCDSLAKFTVYTEPSDHVLLLIEHVLGSRNRPLQELLFGKVEHYFQRQLQQRFEHRKESGLGAGRG